MREAYSHHYGCQSWAVYCQTLQNAAQLCIGFRICTNRIFHSVSATYFSLNSASHSCGSDEGSLQPSLWLPKLSSILQKFAKWSTALHGSSWVRYFGRIEFFIKFLQYTALSTQPATHVAVMRNACRHHYGCQSWAAYCRNLQNAAVLYMHLQK